MVRLQLDQRPWQKIEAVPGEKRGPDGPGGTTAIECTFNLLKQARRFATRYEKTLRNYSAVVALGCALLWLRI